MSAAANEHCFSQPHWKVIAGGFDTEKWFGENIGVGTGGIVMPQVVNLRTGQNYYRFASSNKPVANQRGGGWWLDFENYKKIERFAQSNQYSMRDSARLMLALPIDWTRVDRLVCAMLAKPMKAYAGEGKPARGSGNSTWIPTQHTKVCQLYVPGLFTKGTKPGDQLYEFVFTNFSTKSLL